MIFISVFYMASLSIYFPEQAFELHKTGRRLNTLEWVAEAEQGT